MEEPAEKRIRLGCGPSHSKPVQPNEWTERKLVESVENLYHLSINRCICSLDLEGFLEGFQYICLGITKGKYCDETQLLFSGVVSVICEMTHKQGFKGTVCSKLSDLCEAFCDSEFHLISALLCLLSSSKKYLSYSASKTILNLLVVDKGQLTSDVTNLLIHNIVASPNTLKVGHSIDILSTLMDWKENETHPMDDEENDNCNLIAVEPSELTRMGDVKSMVIKNLETQWTSIVTWFLECLLNYCDYFESCLISFIGLWEKLIAVKTNLSVAETRQFYMRLETLFLALNSEIPSTLWKRVLDLSNEVLCYGSTLSLQDSIADEPLHLSQLVTRLVKEKNFLNKVPFTHGFYGFGGAVDLQGTLLDMPYTDYSGDRPLLQKISLLILKSVAVLSKDTRGESEESSCDSESGSDIEIDTSTLETVARDTFQKLDAFMKSKLPFHPESPISEWVIKLLSDQDDALIEAMICILDIHATILITRESSAVLRVTNPNMAVTQFFNTIGNDPDVLLDLLVSNETSFLLFLLKYLKYMRKHWASVVEFCGRKLDDFMTVLIRLRMSIEKLVTKRLFPYNIAPVLRHLEKCEELYER